MALRIEIHDRSVRKRIRSMLAWKITSEEKRALVRFLEELELGKVNKGKKISESRQVKYVDVLKAPLEYFGKSVQRVSLKDVEHFEKALSSGALKSRRGGPYSHASKVDIRRALRVYLRWRLGKKRADGLTDWLDTRHITKTPDFIREGDVERLYKACKSPEERFLIAVLFDTGARAGEFHNIRYEDIQLPEANGSFIKIALREEYSKTKGRTVSLFWKHSLDAVREYLSQRQAEGISSAEPVFTRTYTAARLFLHRLGKKILNRSVHYHLFRHSSATYYADKMNRQQLCIRFGWAFSSRMSDIYIARAGVDSQELDQRFKGTEVETLRASLVKIEQDAKLKAERIQHLEQTIHTIQTNFDAISRVVAANPSVQRVESALKERELGVRRT